jgi:hypothetical protein
MEVTMNQQLARLTTLNPRDVWAHEAHDFTPWLLANADALAETLGIDLELTANEHRVGSFALDLIGRDLTNDCVLIVENQLEGTDHGHLGQLVTYAAGTDAGTVVWMATAFREEHRQALDWLNNQTAGNARFFGIEIGAVQIAESPAAPLFRLRAQPNDWHAQTTTAAKSTAQGGTKSGYYLQFWEQLLQRVHEQHPNWTNRRKSATTSWLPMPCPFKGGPCFSVSFTTQGRMRTELYIDFPDPEAVAELYGFLLDLRSEIEGIYGAPLTWEELPGRRACRIADYRAANVANIDNHNEYIDWVLGTGTRIREALSGPATLWRSRPSVA